MGQMVVIGIAGPSCSGKSTVAGLLAGALDAPLLRMDGRYVKGYRRPVVNGYESFEQPEQYDAESLVRDLDAAQEGTDTVVTEGFLLFRYPAILARTTHRFYVEVPHAELVRRRKARVAAGGDAVWGPNGGNPAADAGWLAHGEQEWLAHGACQAQVPGMTVLDGMLPPGVTVEAILAAVQA